MPSLSSPSSPPPILFTYHTFFSRFVFASCLGVTRAHCTKAQAASSALPFLTLVGPRPIRTLFNPHLPTYILSLGHSCRGSTKANITLFSILSLLCSPLVVGFQIALLLRLSETLTGHSLNRPMPTNP
jgi:hypothetical protein